MKRDAHIGAWVCRAGVFILLGTFANTSALASILSNGDFESGATGWQLNSGTGGGSVALDASAQSSFSAGTQGLKFVDNGADSTHPFIRNDFAAQTAGQYTFAFDFQLAAIVNQVWKFRVRDGASADAFIFQIRHDNLELGESKTQVVGNFAAATWYHVELTLDSASDKFIGGSAYDGTTLQTWTTEVAANANNNDFSQFLLLDNSEAGVAADLLLDNVSLTAIPEPASLFLILGAGGGLLMVRRLRI